MGYGKPGGVVRGECRGGLGGAAAPNRPPSAARRAGGPNKEQRKSPRARRTIKISSQRPSLFPAARRAGGPNKEQRKSPRARRAIKIPSKGQAFPRRPPSAARRAGGPKKAGNESAASRAHRAARIKPANAKSPRAKATGALTTCTNKHQQKNINSKKPSITNEYKQQKALAL